MRLRRQPVHISNPKPETRNPKPETRNPSTSDATLALSRRLQSYTQLHMETDSEEHLPAARWAYWLMGIFLAGMLIVSFTVWLDRQNRTKLEQISQPTAVGDPVTIRFDPRQNPGREVLRWKGQGYFLQTNELAELPDFDVRKVEKDDSGKIQLYQAPKQSDQRVVLVKVAVGQFVVLTPR